MNYTIDQEFKNANRKLTQKERDGLYKKIAEDGVRDGSLVCGQIEGDPALYLVDGHTTVEICQEQGIRPPSPTVKMFKSREAVLEWIHELARSRRNLSPEEMAAARAKRIERVAAARQDGKSIRAIAKDEGVSKTQVADDIEEATVQGWTVEPKSGKIKGNDDRERPAHRTSAFCARCQRVGQTKDCPGCATLRAGPSRSRKKTQTAVKHPVVVEPAKPRKSQPITDTRCKNLLNLCAAALSEEDADKALAMALDAAKKARELCLDLVNHPTLEEVQEFIAEAKVKVDAQVWLDHYQANGWMVGKQRMRDWRACVRNWGRNSKQWERSDGKATGRVSSPQSSIDAWERKAARTRA